MRLLMPIGVLLIVIGAGGTVASCYGSSIFQDAASSKSAAAQLDDASDSPAKQSEDSTGRFILAPLAGLTLAIGLACVGIGMGNWRRPIPSDVRPANPWSDQPGEHGDPPKGLV
jgi:hypothetical protein